MDWYNRKMTRTADMDSVLLSFQDEADSLDYAMRGDEEDYSRASQRLYVTATFRVTSDAYVVEEIDELKDVPEIFLENDEFMRKMEDAAHTPELEVDESITDGPELTDVKVLKLTPGPHGMGYSAIVQVEVEQVLRGSPSTGPDWY